MSSPAFQELLALTERLKREVAAEVDAAGPRYAKRVTDRLNQATRRILSADSLSSWVRFTLDGSEGFCERAGFIAIESGTAKLEAGRGLDPAPVTVPVAEAPAIAGVVESREPVVTMVTPGQFSPGLAAAFQGPEEDDAERGYLFPISNGQQVAAVLFASGSEVDPAALELLAGVASLGLERRAAASKTEKTLVALEPASQPAEAAPVQPDRNPRPGWEDLSREEQDLHRKAQRFARVRVAEMRLYKGEAVKAGRVTNSVHSELKDEITAARDEFRSQFLEKSPTMVDYLHLELVATLAKGDDAMLGVDYPGPMS